MHPTSEEPSHSQQNVPGRSIDLAWQSVNVKQKRWQKMHESTTVAFPQCRRSRGYPAQWAAREPAVHPRRDHDKATSMHERGRASGLLPLPLALAGASGCESSHWPKANRQHGSRLSNA